MKKDSISKEFMKKLEKIFEEQFGGKCAIAFCFTLPPNYKDCFYATNVSRADGIKLFQETAQKMLIQTN